MSGLHLQCLNSLLESDLGSLDRPMPLRRPCQAAVHSAYTIMQSTPTLSLAIHDLC